MTRSVPKVSRSDSEGRLPRTRRPPVRFPEPAATGHRLILDNATRLIKDAVLLVDHSRYASAFALAVLAIEEYGKALLREWEVERPLPKPRRGASAHLQKHTSVASLLISSLLFQKLFPTQADLERDDIVAAAVKAFHESEEGRLFLEIRAKGLEKRKQKAMYQDDDMLTAVEDDFAEMHVNSIFRIVHEVAEAVAVSNPYTRSSARVFYEVLFLQG
jgi:AbiV family abortive infection protein